MDAKKTTIVLGGPGAGKTTSLLNVVEEALSSGVRPDKVGFISFTKKATDEGRRRASERFSIPPGDLPHFRTLHSMAFKHLGTRRDQVVGWQHMKELGKMLGLDFKGRTHGEVAEDDVYGMTDADRMVFLEGLARNTKRQLKKVWDEAFEDSIDWFELDRFAASLASFKKKRALLDFNDMIELFCASDPRTLPQLDLLIVDEIQDTSPLQWDAIELLSSVARKVYVGGDDCQAIYKWSGADVGRFISLPGNQITLEQSYRVPSAVHKLANGLSDMISNKRQRSWKPRQEVGSISWFGSVEEVDLSKGTWLLLARNGYLLNELEDWCLSQGFSFHSVNRDPLKSRSLEAIRVWESLRRGQDASAGQILDTLRYAPSSLVDASLLKRLKDGDPGSQYGMSDLVGLGLKVSGIWHESLLKISPKERDFFIAARKRGEPLLKEPRIRISTIHSVKGGEADHVLLLTDVSYRTFSNMETSFDDEVRVWYVAVTRCRQTLSIVMPKTNLFFEL